MSLFDNYCKMIGITFIPNAIRSKLYCHSIINIVQKWWKCLSCHVIDIDLWAVTSFVNNSRKLILKYIECRASSYNCSLLSNSILTVCLNVDYSSRSVSIQCSYFTFCKRPILEQPCIPSVHLVKNLRRIWLLSNLITIFPLSSIISYSIS